MIDITTHHDQQLLRGIVKLKINNIWKISRKEQKLLKPYIERFIDYYLHFKETDGGHTDYWVLYFQNIEPHKNPGIYLIRDRSLDNKLTIRIIFPNELKIKEQWIYDLSNYKSAFKQLDDCFEVFKSYD